MLQTRDIDVDSVRNWKFCRSVLVSLPIKKMNLFLHMLAAMALQYGTVKVNGQKYVLTSSCVGVVTEGSSCVLTCETGDATETPIAWTRGANAPYEVDRATCTKSTPSVPSDYVLACPGTSFTLNITAASVTQDKTTWICDAVLGGKDSNITHLDVQALDTTTTTSRTTDNPTSTPEGSTVTVPTTPTPGICKNHLCYLFFLLLLIPIIAVVVCCCCCSCCSCCRKKKKRTSHTNTNAMNRIGEQNESMSPEDKVNNDTSDQMRL